MYLGRGVVLRACALLAVCAATRADSPDPLAKRAESELMSPMPFVLGSRYGRSQQRLISPRNDKFFMGSRYGKRSEPPRLPIAPARALLCEPTGLFQLYRCSAHAPDVIRRFREEREPSQLSEEE